MFLKTMIVFGAIQLAFVTINVSVAHGQSLQSAPMIFDARKSLPLEPDEPAYHDFYINAGTEVGFKKGQFVSVVRLVPVHDPVQNKQQAVLSVSIAKLRIIQAERNIAVARLEDELTDEDRPTLEYEAVMIGDRVDLASITTEAPKAKKAAPAGAKKKSAEQKPADLPAKVVEKPTLPADSAPVEVASQAGPGNAAGKAIPGESSDSKNASPSANPAGMVRVPVPSAKTL